MTFPDTSLPKLLKMQWSCRHGCQPPLKYECLIFSRVSQGSRTDGSLPRSFLICTKANSSNLG